MSQRQNEKIIRPALKTSATAIIALNPVLASQGRSADVMVPMALPIVRGMFLDLITIFVVPTIYCLERNRIQTTKGRGKLDRFRIGKVIQNTGSWSGRLIGSRTIVEA